MKTKRILLFTGSYLPGTKSAGVTTSVSNMCRFLYPDVEFYILTEDRDIGENEPYNNVPLEQWTKYGNANVFYSRQCTKSLKILRQVMCSKNFDAYYINGFYNIKDNFRPMMLYFLKQVPRKQLIIAPRGIFSLGKYDNRLILRKIYRLLFRLSDLGRHTIWHASSKLEKKHIIQRFPNAHVHILQNPTDIVISDTVPTLPKIPGTLKAMFISRISEKKNIKYIIDILSRVKGNVTMDFYGMISTKADKQYWAECENVMRQLPKNIKCNYCGTVDRHEVYKVYQSHHLFIFPTFGENFGHVIAESLANGCPILLSDQTPWNMLELYEAGWNIPLTNKDKFIRSLQNVIDMDLEQWHRLSFNSLKVAHNYLDKDVLIKQYKDFFLSL